MYELNKIEKRFLTAFDIHPEDYHGVSLDKQAELEKLASVIEGRIHFQELPNGWVLNDFYVAESKSLALMKCLSGADSVSPLFRGSGIEKQVRGIFVKESYEMNTPEVEKIIKEVKAK